MLVLSRGQKKSFGKTRFWTLGISEEEEENILILPRLMFLAGNHHPPPLNFEEEIVLGQQQSNQSIVNIKNSRCLFSIIKWKKVFYLLSNQWYQNLYPHHHQLNLQMYHYHKRQGLEIYENLDKLPVKGSGLHKRKIQMDKNLK